MSERQPMSGTSTRRLPRTRGATSGLLLVVLGAWGALVPFIGPWFKFAFSPDKSWHWTAARGWLEVLPGAVTVLGGLLLLVSASRITTNLGAWLGIAGGAWFIVGPQLAVPLHLGSVGSPTGSSTGLRAIEWLAYFYALGAVILFLSAAAFGRLSVVTVRDLRVAERRDAERREAEEAAARNAAERQSRQRAAQQRAEQERAEAERAEQQRVEQQRADAERTSGRRDGAHEATDDGQEVDSSGWALRRDAAARDGAERTGGATAANSPSPGGEQYRGGDATDLPPGYQPPPNR